MKYFFVIIFIAACFNLSLEGQTFTDSNLPIVLITTDDGEYIPDEPGVLGNMKIIYRGPGQRNYLTDQNNAAYLNYNGRIDIEIRGSSSQSSLKKNYGFTTLMADNMTNNNVSLLGMPEENDWILGGMVFDTALIRDYLCDNLSRQMGQYASRTSYCEVLINNTYAGLYILQEKIKADKNRVNVEKITTFDNTLPNLSGGYIIKADKTTGGDPIAWTMSSWWGATVDYIFVLPKPKNAIIAQKSYIKGEFTKLETATNNNNASIIDGYPSLIDIPSFIDYMIINELASNPDAYQFSTYFHKDRNGKLRAGPIWDLDLSFGNDLFMWGYDRSKTNLWYFIDEFWNNGSKFWNNLFVNSQYKCYLSKRWNELILPGQPLNQASIEAFIDQTVDSISEAVAREYSRWGKTGSHQDRIDFIKSFISLRSDWITDNLGSFDACSNVDVPPLVITKIMYHPATTAQYTNDDDLEFLEIRNNSNATIDLTGVYFTGTGFIYQFPVDATLGPDMCVILASNSTAFKATYGFLPYGQFTRNLSNSDQRLVLADAFGNIIDSLHYYDASPWPLADGNGYYLKLTDINLDNSLASNWIASSDLITGSETITEDSQLIMYPNPVDDFLHIQSTSAISSIKLFDFNGHLLIHENVDCEAFDLDMRQFSNGTYIIRISTADKVYSEKIIRN